MFFHLELIAMLSVPLFRLANRAGRSIDDKKMAANDSRSTHTRREQVCIISRPSP